MKTKTNKYEGFWKLAREFLHTYLPLTAGRSSETVNAYKAALEMYISFLLEIYKIEKKDIHFECFERDKVKEFITWMKKEKKYSPKTINLKLTALRSFLKFAGEEDIELMHFYISINSIKGQKVPKRPIEFMNEKAIIALLSSTEPDSKIHRRNRIMLILMYDLGTRVQEIVNLTLSSLHIDNDHPYVTVYGKGNKYRQVPIMKKTIGHLKEYIKEFHTNNENLPLFYTYHDGNPHALSTDSVEVILKKAAKLARLQCSDIPKKVYCHLIRKTRAMDLYRSGIPLHIIARFLGHENVSTTSGFYAFATFEMITEAIKKVDASPVNTVKHYDANKIDEFLYSLD